jgi:hypothetical protein
MSVGVRESDGWLLMLKDNLVIRLGDLFVNWKIILNFILNNFILKLWIGLNWFSSSMAEFFELDSAPAGSMKQDISSFG